MRHHAFTLVELLVVISVLGILMGLLLPAVSLVKASAQKTRCMAHERQIGQSMMAYATDNQDYLPPIKSWAGINWGTPITPYIEAVAVSKTTNMKRGGALWGCPRWKGNLADATVTVRGDAVGYGMNASLIDTAYHSNFKPNDWGTGSELSARLVKMAKITQTSRRVLTGDANDWNIYGTNGTQPAESVASDWSLTGQRHGSRTNLLFADLHVETLDLTRFSVAAARGGTDYLVVGE